MTHLTLVGWIAEISCLSWLSYWPFLPSLSELCSISTFYPLYGGRYFEFPYSGFNAVISDLKDSLIVIFLRNVPIFYFLGRRISYELLEIKILIKFVVSESKTF